MLKIIQRTERDFAVFRGSYYLGMVFNGRPDQQYRYTHSLGCCYYLTVENAAHALAASHDSLPDNVRAYFDHVNAAGHIAV